MGEAAVNQKFVEMMENWERQKKEDRENLKRDTRREDEFCC